MNLRKLRIRLKGLKFLGITDIVRTFFPKTAGFYYRLKKGLLNDIGMGGEEFYSDIFRLKDHGQFLQRGAAIGPRSTGMAVTLKGAKDKNQKRLRLHRLGFK